jgi:hypothetical protein
MTFLIRDDRDFLEIKALAFAARVETMPDGTTRRWLMLEGFAVEGRLFASVDTTQPQVLTPQQSCTVAIQMPDGYPTTKLDSFYTFPRLVRADGGCPINANGEMDICGQKFQFWSRHLDNTEWRPGQDGLETYVNYVRRELRVA